MTLPIQHTPQAFCDVPRDWAADFSQCLYEWQGLEAGVLALLAAGLGAFFIWKQISQERDFENQRLARRAQAVRSVSTLAFSQICRASQRLMTRLGALLRMSPNERVRATDGPLGLDLSNEIVPTLERLLEATDDNHLIDVVSELITRVQVTESRLESTVVTTSIELEDRILDLAGVYAFSEALLEFARRDRDSPPFEIETDRIRAILRISHVREARNPQVYQRFDGQYQDDPIYWRWEGA